ncbi:MAG: 50S ribosomal protein L6 [Deltaproteobacteria bacterium]|nr:50S ribosomal protein L6 [Deltaproteobacteria bacterium]
MSRIGKLPIAIPAGVGVRLEEGRVFVEWSKGKMERLLPAGVTVAREGETIVVKRDSNSRNDKAMHGLTRTLVANMIKGASGGFEKVLEISGVGYRAEFDNATGILRLLVGYSKPVEYKIPDGVAIKVDKQVNISISGYDKELVGLVAAQIRGIKKPEPYKGKGIKYANEVVRRKAGKSVGSKK